jgi:nucleotide-binding universal stress UspA family protein
MKIVVALDGSPVSKRALLEALELSRRLRDAPEVHIVSVVDHIVPPGGLGKAPEGAPDLLVPEAETALAAAEEIAAAKGVEVETHMLRGHVGAQILGYADQIGADLIVLGTHGRKGLARAVLGSACEHVVRESREPVLTVHGPG